MCHAPPPLSGIDKLRCQWPMHSDKVPCHIHNMSPSIDSSSPPFYNGFDRNHFARVCVIHVIDNLTLCLLSMFSKDCSAEIEFT